ncbi:MAG: HEPN domain-containing protein [Chloroflexi bacterium]|nr:HEPN domain-containing protein [Chloroflexota bacterium]
MSNLDIPEFERWYKQAENALESAQGDNEHAYYNWACFKAQQAAEYALKGLYRALGKVVVGQPCYKLVTGLRTLEVSVPRGIAGKCRFLDRHYIPTRYPDAFAEASPFEFYDKAAAQQAITGAREVLDFVNGEVKRFGKSP